ncbi:hypothetical protein C2G38_2232276 [Gigaspora rosea]|uniref:Uncharacterized protein n=1 Tax=Gigaspora rosea TaxID=44941 RepID=A0A397TVN9_9GLOM|nr:hypothetical protein C2G38_2232276 [Gigaspora rosea]
MRKNKTKRHRLTEFIEVLKEKSNEYNHFAICNACKEAKGQDYTYSNKFVNTKRLVKSHLKNCTYFKNEKEEDEAKRILDNTDSEKSKNKKKRQREYDSDEEFSTGSNIEVEQTHKGH